MLTGGQLVVLFRVRLFGRASFWPRWLVRSSAESTTGEISLVLGHAMEVRLSHRLQSGFPPFMPYKACLLLLMIGVFIALLTRNCNINKKWKFVNTKKKLCKLFDAPYNSITANKILVHCVIPLRTANKKLMSSSNAPGSLHWCARFLRINVAACLCRSSLARNWPKHSVTVTCLKMSHATLSCFILI